MARCIISGIFLHFFPARPRFLLLYPVFFCVNNKRKLEGLRSHRFMKMYSEWRNEFIWILKHPSEYKYYILVPFQQKCPSLDLFCIKLRFPKIRILIGGKRRITPQFIVRQFLLRSEKVFRKIVMVEFSKFSACVIKTFATTSILIKNASKHTHTNKLRTIRKL